jgi:hypothetical protein
MMTERRSIARTKISKSASLFLGARRGVFGCEVRDITNVGAGLRFEGINIWPIDFELSFDNFRSARKCRVAWRNGYVAGVAFEN